MRPRHTGTATLQLLMAPTNLQHYPRFTTARLAHTQHIIVFVSTAFVLALLRVLGEESSFCLSAPAVLVTRAGDPEGAASPAGQWLLAGP